jgi:catechol 2,3-dioxygenase-like lactoylglutathione lyase family enzyme
MRPTSYYPVLGCRDVAAARDFYVRHFDFEVGFEIDWYVHLRHREAPTVNLALVAHAHESVPAAHRRPADGLLLNFEIDDVDGFYQRCRAAGLPIALDLRDEAWGQRHFILVDPNGVLVDVIKVIPPSAEFADAYKLDVPA